MSYKDGMMAINLQMPDRVPRTEYSAEGHWELIKKITGIDVSHLSDDNVKSEASRAFMKAWNYDFKWNILIHNQIFGCFKTTMGHAVYASGGVDYNNVLNCPFKDEEDALKLDFYQSYGKKDRDKLVNDFNEHYKASCKYFDDAVNMTGIYVTCISGLIEIFGWDMLLSMAGTDGKAFGELTDRYCQWMAQYFEALSLCDAPVVMVHDDIVWTEGPFLHPDWYRKYVFPNYKKMFAPLHEKNKKIIYTSDGCFTKFIDDIADAGINGFVMEPLTDMAYIAEKYGKTHSFIGNADTRILFDGSKEDIYKEVKRCMDIGKKYPGFFMAVGNHIPANTPVDNCLYYNEAYELYSKR